MHFDSALDGFMWREITVGFWCQCKCSGACHSGLWAWTFDELLYSCNEILVCTLTVTELQKVNFTVTVFNSRLHIIPALHGSVLRAAARVSDWNIEIHLDELKDMQRTYPAGLCQIGFCVSGSLVSSGMWSAGGVCRHVKGSRPLRPVSRDAQALSCCCCWSLWHAVWSRRIQTWCNSDTQCS